MLGAVVKTWFAKRVEEKPENIYSVSIMPCTAKKFEAQREDMTHQGISDVDAVMTTRELAQLINLYGVELNKLEPELTDSPLGIRSSAGKLFAGSGGVMEAALRTAYYKITGNEMTEFKVNAVRGLDGRKETQVRIGDLTLGIAVVSGLQNAKELLDEIRNGRSDIHFIEIMACPGGCIAGGGQTIGADEDAITARLKSLYTIDEQASIKVSHKNPEVIELYDQFLEEPLSHTCHKLLHTTYEKREVPL
jgi:iron only hydrogenase large subunit-like protein